MVLLAILRIPLAAASRSRPSGDAMSRCITSAAAWASRDSIPPAISVLIRPSTMLASVTVGAIPPLP